MIKHLRICIGHYAHLPPHTQSQKLFDPVVWLDAATQIFFSLGLSIGALVSLSSYSKPRNNALVDTVIVCLMNSGTSIFASIIVFSVVGFRALELGIEVSLVSCVQCISKCVRFQ